MSRVKKNAGIPPAASISTLATIIPLRSTAVNLTAKGIV